MKVATLVTEIRKGLEPLGDPSRAESEKKYLKSELRFLGTGVPAVRKFAGQFVKQHPELDRATLEALTRAVFATDEYEVRSVGISVLERRVKLLTAADLPWLMEAVRASTTWAHVDWLAPKVIGPILAGLPNQGVHLRKWAKDPNVWVRRTALLAQLDTLREGGGDFDLFAELAVPMLPEKDFWIRKATGWVLREVAKERPELVADFVKKHASKMSGLTFREATRTLSRKLQDEIGERPK